MRSPQPGGQGATPESQSHWPPGSLSTQLVTGPEPSFPFDRDPHLHPEHQGLSRVDLWQQLA